jgi:hypothetical protein
MAGSFAKGKLKPWRAGGSLCCGVSTYEIRVSAMTDEAHELRDLVRRAAHTNQLVAQADINSIWQYGQPVAGASESEIAATESSIGRPLDFQFRSLMAITDGWRGFYHDVDILTVHELRGSPSMSRAWMLAEAANEGSGGLLGLNKDSYLPIAVAQFDIDVFLLNLGPVGSVRWIAGQDVETFMSVASFVEAIIRYNESTLQKLREDPWLGAHR